MKQIWIPRTGGPEVLELREAPDPIPGAGQVRVAVKAVGVNFADIMARKGLYPDAPPFPCVVGYEAAGVVEALGPGVEPALLGRRVMAMTRFGAYSSSLLVPANQLSEIPAGLGFSQAAAIPVNWLTAWMMLRIMAPLWPGCRVLVHNAAGGVGLACLALATDSGAEIWGRAGRAKHEVLRNWGCHHPLDSRSDEWPDQKVDVVLDPIGGASWGRALNSLRVGGRLVVYGFSASTQGSGPAWWGMTRAAAAVPWLRFNPVELMNRNLGVLGVNMGHVWEEAERVGQWLVSCNSFIAERGIKPVVHAEVPFERAAEAHAMLESRDTVGKVVLVP